MINFEKYLYKLSILSVELVVLVSIICYWLFYFLSLILHFLFFHTWVLIMPDILAYYLGPLHFLFNQLFLLLLLFLFSSFWLVLFLFIVVTDLLFFSFFHLLLFLLLFFFHKRYCLFEVKYLYYIAFTLPSAKICISGSLLTTWVSFSSILSGLSV